LRLDPLGKESADEMLSALLFQPALPPGEGQGEGADLSALKRVIIEKTEGNPFFMEEMVQVLLDEGALVRDGAAVRLTKALGELKIPPTVQGILAARIDRLPSDAKDLLQTLAVIGREFPLSLIRAVVAKSDDELNRMLNDLQLGEFIYEQPAVGDTEYIFKHALTQEVAYNSLLIERRKQMHERIGGALGSLYADSLDDHLSELAHHFSRSADIDRAVQFLTLAGKQSLARYAYAESQARLREGLLHLEKLPESPQRDVRELELARALADVIRVSVGVDAPETREAAQRAASLAEKTGNLAELIRQLNLRRIIILRSGDFAGAASIANQLLELAEREGSASSFANAYHATLQAHFFSGDLAGTETQFTLWRNYQDATVSGVDSTGRVVVIATAALCASMMGCIHLARDRIGEATAFAVATKDPFLLMIGKFVEGLFYRHLREPGGVMTAVSQSMAISEENLLPFAPGVRSLKGWALAQLGNLAEGLVLVRDDIADSATGKGGFLSHARDIRSELQAMAGMYEAAMDSIQEVLSIENQDESFRPECLRVRGEIWQRLGNSDAAEADFRAAVARSKEMNAKMFELRATTSLARLLRDTNRREEARAMLAEIYGWFTEGFDTADLKDAKAILDELSA